MLTRVEVPVGYRLQDYAHRAFLAPAVRELEAAARELVPRLAGRTVWMINSTAAGGGVAEMMPRLVSLLRQVGLAVEWAVVGSEAPRFFPFTKRLHTMIHGLGEARLDPEDAACYEAESAAMADAIAACLSPGDLLVVHDPQPLAAGALARRRLGVRAAWRCHIGREGENDASRAAWDFLRPWAQVYDLAIFSLPEYAPAYLADRAVFIPPAIDPLSHKNRDLPTPKLTGILVDAGLALSPFPCVAPAFGAPALRLQPGGGFAPATTPSDFALLFRPIILQVSRWDGLKGFAPLLAGFAALKTGRMGLPRGERHQRTVELAGLVLGGPDPEAVADDPEARAVLAEIAAAWQALPEAVRKDVAILNLPMRSVKENALMVNALQRCASIVVQNSIEEGFGLTATEAMWKGLPVLASAATGLRAQIRDGREGRLVADPRDAGAIAERLDDMLGHEKAGEEWAANAHNRVFEHYLIFAHARRHLEALARLAEA